MFSTQIKYFLSLHCVPGHSGRRDIGIHNAQKSPSLHGAADSLIREEGKKNWKEVLMPVSTVEKACWQLEASAVEGEPCNAEAQEDLTGETEIK